MKQKSYKKIILLVILTLLVIMAVVLILDRRGSINLFGTNSNTSRVDESGINFSPATDEEVTAGGQEDQPTDNFPETHEDNRTKVTPIISTWVQNTETGNLELNAFVPAIVEQDGVCTLVLRKQESEITRTKSARADAQTTTCGIIEVDEASINPGVWTARVSYSSSSSSGNSNSVEVEIK